jgi:hypothetical protein
MEKYGCFLGTTHENRCSLSTRNVKDKRQSGVCTKSARRRFQTQEICYLERHLITRPHETGSMPVSRLGYEWWKRHRSCEGGSAWLGGRLRSGAVILGLGAHPFSLCRLFHHPLSCCRILFLLGLQFEDVNQLVNGICGDVGGWYDSCDCVGQVVGGTYEGIGWSWCGHSEVFVLEIYCAANPCMTFVTDEYFVAAIMLPWIANVESTCCVWCPRLSYTWYQMCFDFAAKRRKWV